MQRGIKAAILVAIGTLVFLPPMVHSQPGKGVDDKIADLLKSEGHEVTRDEKKAGKPVVAVRFT